MNPSNQPDPPATAESAPAPASLRGFWSLIVTQFQGAFNDNVLKNLVVFLIVGMNMALAREA